MPLPEKKALILQDEPEAQMKMDQDDMPPNRVSDDIDDVD